MREKKHQKTMSITVFLAVGLLFIISPGIRNVNAGTKSKTPPPLQNKAFETGSFSKSKKWLRRSATTGYRRAVGGGSESLVSISPDDISIEGPLTSYSEEDREITIKGEIYRLCDNVAVFYQTPKYLRRVSITNIETAEEARIFIDSRLSCVKELVILKAGR